MKNFANEWYERGDEDSDCQIFWLTLLRDVLTVDKPERLIEFQKPVAGKHIDAYIARTKTLIEHKSFGVDLNKKIPQSDGTLLTPYEQAKRYADSLPANEKPRWIVTCNFAEFRIYDTTKNLFEPEPTVIKLRELRYQYRRLSFLIDPNADTTSPTEKISKDAIGIIKNIYDEFARNYRGNNVDDFADALNKICMRIVFCLYAGDAKIFADNQFFNYLQNFPDSERNAALQRIFDTLNTPDNLRGDLDDELKKFPYVNGGLFDEKIPLPAYNKDVGNSTASIGTFNARRQFSWHEIDPPVFGAMFESVFSRANRQRDNRQREGGMYYTTTDNIDKVIKPLFMDDLRDEFELAKRKQLKNRAQALINLQDKLAALKFLDPACGSGNFLTHTYISLRRLENEILEELRGLVTLPADPVKVSIEQFSGIEIDPFAATIAQTALWIAENQMLQDTEGALGIDLNALPLKNYATIVCDNALRVDWSSVAPHVDYIIGNPPFVGARLKSVAQKTDMQFVFDDNYNIGNLDYVTCWYKKAADYIRGRKIRCAFVSTNSVCQGDSVGALWKNLFAEGIHIDFAHRTFNWLSDSENMAHVHCVVVGFSSAPNPKPKKIFDGENVHVAENINAYLVDGEDIFVESRNEHYQAGVPKMRFGSMPNDGGNLIIEADDLDYFLQHEPAAEKYIRLFLGADEFIKSKQRYCLWLDGVTLDEIKKMPLVAKRVEAVKNYRSLSKRAATRKLADTPMLFGENRQPTTNYILVPSTSSEQRQYIPIGFMDDSVICSNRLKLVSDATIYHFGVLTSSIHMAWMRMTAGRLESRYLYSNNIVYNNFPWCEVTDTRRQTIETTAQHILDVRAKYPDWTFAALYDESTMPDDLRDAHKLNDTAVALAYGFDKILHDEAQVVAELMKLYRRLTS